MGLTHRLTYNNTTTVISEPIGFDGLQMMMKRHEYHGMGVESSLGNLEFYGEAASIIETAYAADIDSDVIYNVQSDGITIYQGRLDLSTRSHKQGDYESVSVKVGEIGIKTTFNNHAGTEIDLDDPKTVDGVALQNTPTWMQLHIPMKHLPYTNHTEQKEDYVIDRRWGDVPSGDHFYFDSTKKYIFLPIGTNDINEFGTWAESETPYVTDDISVVDPQYVSENDHDTKYGMNTVAHIDATIRFSVVNTPDIRNVLFKIAVAVISNGGQEIYEGASSGGYIDTDTIHFSPEISVDVPADGSIKYYLVADFSSSSYSACTNIWTVKSTSFVKMVMFDNLADDNKRTSMLFIHDALNVVSHAISGDALSVKSDWYCLPESQWQAGSIPQTGSGALKAITNGYKIRGLFTDSNNKRNMPMSFKSLIEALDALDCIGWGFSTEDDVLYVRVEHWDWFYKSDVILTLTDVAEVQVDVDTDRIPTEMKIGYKKYATQDQYNSIDSPHGMRTFVRGIEAVSKSISKECEFVADNYAIEETRRARQLLKGTEETTYDENVFVFELVCQMRGIGDVSFFIGHTAENATNVGRVSEFINAKLTPRKMAARWQDYLFAANSTKPFNFTVGEINYKSWFATIPPYSLVSGTATYSLQAVEARQAEFAPIGYEHAKFKAEKITFSCPLTIEQYNTVKSNPYGLVSVNGMQGWITEFKYSLEDGMADFTLLAKYTS